CEINGGPNQTCTPNAVALQPPPSTKGIEVAIAAAIKQFEGLRPSLTPQEVTTVETALDDLDSNQRMLATSMKSIDEAQAGLLPIGRLLASLTPTFTAEHVFRSTLDDKNIRALGLGRTASVKVIAQDLISKEKKPLGSITIAWGG